MTWFFRARVAQPPAVAQQHAMRAARVTAVYSQLRSREEVGAVAQHDRAGEFAALGLVRGQGVRELHAVHVLPLNAPLAHAVERDPVAASAPGSYASTRPCVPFMTPSS